MFDLSPNDSPDARIYPKPHPCDETGPLRIAAYAELDGIGMGRLSDGSVYLTQRGLARLCGVQNAHIGAIGRDWNTDKPRIKAIKARLARFGEHRTTPYRVLVHEGHRQYAYDMAVVQALLDYYTLDASQPQPEAMLNRNRFRGIALETYIHACLAPQPSPPLRFTPLQRPAPDMTDAIDAMILYICSLCGLSLLLAGQYLEGLKQRALNARWNRLGLYLPLKAFLEIQAEAVLRASRTFPF